MGSPGVELDRYRWVVKEAQTGVVLARGVGARHAALTAAMQRKSRLQTRAQLPRPDVLSSLAVCGLLDGPFVARLMPRGARTITPRA